MTEYLFLRQEDVANFYTKAEIDDIMANLEVPEHDHDDRYYTETEVDGLLDGKADTAHTHDDRYYTETEVDSLLDGKADTSHTHDDRYYTETEVDSLLSSHTHDDRYYTEAEVDGFLAGKEDADADILKADTSDTLEVGYDAIPADAGTQTGGTFTPDPADGNFQTAVNGGAHTLAPPGTTCTIVIQYTNNSNAGAITTSGFTAVDGDDLTTGNGDDFLLFITQIGAFSYLSVKALQ